jgi:hypothetical protein
MVWPKMIPLKRCPLYCCMLAYLLVENGSEQFRRPKVAIGVDIETFDAGRKASEVVDFHLAVAVDVKAKKTARTPCLRFLFGSLVF